MFDMTQKRKKVIKIRNTHRTFELKKKLKLYVHS
jgi:hypothetical protein